MDRVSDDPTRAFLDQTVPKHDEWDGREPEEGPARPRHVQYPTEPAPPLTAKERRAKIARGVGWGAANLAAFAAGAALSDDDSHAELSHDNVEDLSGGYDMGDMGGGS